MPTGADGRAAVVRTSLAPHPSHAVSQIDYMIESSQPFQLIEDPLFLHIPA
jgi:hypothetical protein